MIKYLSFLFYLSPLGLFITNPDGATLNNIEPTDISIEANTVLESITFSNYNVNTKKFDPVKVRTLNYSPDFTEVTYVETSQDGKVIEKVISKHKDGMLLEMQSDLKGSKSKQVYSYNDNGLVLKRTYASDNSVHIDEYTYDGKRINSLMSVITVSGEEKSRSVEEYDYGLSKGFYSKKRTSNGQSSFTNYKLNQQGAIVEKDEVYTRHRIEYNEGKAVQIISEAKEYENNMKSTSLTYYPDGRLQSSHYKEEPIELKSEFSYDKNGNLVSIQGTEKDGMGSSYFKYEFTNYNQFEKMIHPPWYVDRGLINRNLFIDVNNSIKEQDMNAAIHDGDLSTHMPVYPESYIIYSSKDGKNWQPDSKMQFTFKQM